MTDDPAFLTDAVVANPDLRDRWRALNGLIAPNGQVPQRISSIDPSGVHVTVASPTRTTITTWTLKGPI